MLTNSVKSCKIYAVMLWNYCFPIFITLCNDFAVHQVHSNVTIATWPEGPVYPAATWLRVACRHDHAEQHRLQYRWTGGCNSTGETSLSVPDPLYDQFGWAVIWVQSTPATCLDSFQCSVFLHDNNGGDLTEIASEVFLLQNIAGELVIDQNYLVNNTEVSEFGCQL